MCLNWKWKRKMTSQKVTKKKSDRHSFLDIINKKSTKQVIKKGKGVWMRYMIKKNQTGKKQQENNKQTKKIHDYNHIKREDNQIN